MTKYTISCQFGAYVADDNMGNCIWSTNVWELKNRLLEMGYKVEFNL